MPFFIHSLLVRLRLVVPFASLIWEHPKADECDIMEWIKVLVPLLGVSLDESLTQSVSANHLLL